MPMPCARSRSLASAPGSRVPNPSPAHVLTCSSPLVCQSRAPSYGPNGAATPPCNRSWQQSRRSPPHCDEYSCRGSATIRTARFGLPLNTVLMFPLPHPLKFWGLRKSRGGSSAQLTFCLSTPPTLATYRTRRSGRTNCTAPDIFAVKCVPKCGKIFWSVPKSIKGDERVWHAKVLVNAATKSAHSMFAHQMIVIVGCIKNVRIKIIAIRHGDMTGSAHRRDYFAIRGVNHAVRI
jgi:hypothetical protein